MSQWHVVGAAPDQDQGAAAGARSRAARGRGHGGQICGRAPRVLALRDRRSRGISLLLCSLGASATGCEARAGKSGMWPVPLRTPTCRVLLGRSSGAPNSSRKLASGTDRIGGQVRARAVFAAGENVKNGRQAHLGMQQHLEGYLSRIKERILRPQY